ncbi:unnamed protein product [Oikopleura dioica]|uniref:Uncharacterized protein n=1 Tax=Oikopleura dioica TaxID=34765 RepID=E4XF70_OIKDI|nr:unnamed protein product [Oikopleura dioica]
MIIPTEFSEKELNFLDSLTEEPFEFERISEMDSITCYVPFTRGKLQEMIEELAENISYPFNLLFDVAFTYSEKRRNVQTGEWTNEIYTKTCYSSPVALNDVRNIENDEDLARLLDQFPNDDILRKEVENTYSYWYIQNIRKILLIQITVGKPSD